MVLSLSKPLDDLVLAGRESEWNANKSKWFVLDPDCPDQKREPGNIVVNSSLFKSISRSTQG